MKLTELKNIYNQIYTNNVYTNLLNNSRQVDKNPLEVNQDMYAKLDLTIRKIVSSLLSKFYDKIYLDKEEAEYIEYIRIVEPTQHSVYGLNSIFISLNWFVVNKIGEERYSFNPELYNISNGVIFIGRKKLESYLTNFGVPDIVLIYLDQYMRQHKNNILNKYLKQLDRPINHTTSVDKFILELKKETKQISKEFIDKFIGFPEKNVKDTGILNNLNLQTYKTKLIDHIATFIINGLIYKIVDIQKYIDMLSYSIFKTIKYQKRWFNKYMIVIKTNKRVFYIHCNFEQQNHPVNQVVVNIPNIIAPMYEDPELRLVFNMIVNNPILTGWFSKANMRGNWFYRTNGKMTVKILKYIDKILPRLKERIGHYNNTVIKYILKKKDISLFSFVVGSENYKYNKFKYSYIEISNVILPTIIKKLYFKNGQLMYGSYTIGPATNNHIINNELFNQFITYIYNKEASQFTKLGNIQVKRL